MSTSARPFLNRSLLHVSFALALSLLLLGSVPIARAEDEQVGTVAGFKATIFQRAFDYAATVATPILQDSLQNLKLPDTTGQQSFSIIGTIHYTLSQMLIVRYDSLFLDPSWVKFGGFLLSICLPARFYPAHFSFFDIFSLK